jgi:hypothetical protein
MFCIGFFAGALDLARFLQKQAAMEAIRHFAKVTTPSFTTRGNRQPSG